MRPRAIAPVIGMVLLVAIVAGLAGVLVVMLPAIDLGTEPTYTVLSASADAETNEIVLRHSGGPPIDVREIEVVVLVNEQPLARQPPVPYFATAGFVGAPTGPFNQAADPMWQTGQRVSFRIAGTNDPPLHRGDHVVVTLYHDDIRVAVADTTAR